MSPGQDNYTPSHGVTQETLSDDPAMLLREIARLRQQVKALNNEKADLKTLLKLTTEHSDNLEEKLYSKVEATLRDSEKRFRLIAESMPIPVIISRLADNIIVYANAPAGSLLNLPVDAILGHRAPDFYEDFTDHRQLLGMLSQNGHVNNYELRGKTVDNTPFWASVSIQLLDYRDEPSMMIALHDITERKHAEEERLRLTGSLETALEQQVLLTSGYSRFVPREILQFLGKESILEVNLGDQIQQQMTVLFSDIRDFTSLSEAMSPQENFNFINSYLGRVSPIIREHHGFIDKYIGDAIMALFPAQPNDALDAAIAMLQAVTVYNAHRARHNYRPISIGVGLHTGNVMLGTVGEAERMEGTVISDAVNLASRLEGLTKLYGASIVVSEHTLFKLDRLLQYKFRFLDKVKVKGKTDPVSVFEIFQGDPPQVVELKLQTQTDFEKGMLHYHSQEFQAAVEYFHRVLNVFADDRAAQLYLQRARNFIEYGVPVDWEGISALTDK